MVKGVIITSHRSVSLKKVSEDIADVLVGNGVEVVDILGYPTSDPLVYRDLDYVIIVMTFDPAWIVPYCYVQRMLCGMGKLSLFYTTVEGRVKRTGSDYWIYRDLEFIANSGYTRDMLARSGARVREVIYHGVNVEEIQGFKWMRGLVRKRLGVSDNEFLVGYIAGGYMRKGHYLFAEVVKLVEKEDNSIKFVVLTDQDGAKAYAGASNVIVVNEFGELGKDEVYGLYHAMDLYVQASLSEGFGLPVLEALAAGKLVVHADYRPLSEITTENTSVRVPVISRVYKREMGAIEYELHYYDPSAMAEAILKGRELVESDPDGVSSRCVERARELDYKKTYKRFVDIIKSLGKII